MADSAVTFLGTALVVLVLLSSMAVAATPVSISDPKDQQILAGLLQHAARTPQYLSREHCARLAEEDAEGTEAIMWRATPYLRMPLTAYELTRDPQYLDAFVSAFENVRAALTTGPDGFLGWYGFADPEYRDPADPDRRIDAVISSFAVTELVSDFVALVDADPELRTRFARQRSEYLDLAENHLVRKHDVRGDYVDLGAQGGVYRTPPVGLKPSSARLTLPHNKHDIILRALLALHRVTGKDDYLRRAIKLGTRFKRCLTLKDGHYEWNYWDPAGPWDVHPDDPGRWKHWIGPEHRGGYYSLSLSQAVLLYQHGLVFDRTDMDRFVRTQLDMCWNGDLERPVWSRVDGTRPEQYTQGEYIAPALAPFSEKVAEYLFTGPRQERRLSDLSDSWGGVQAGGWLRAKLLEYPAAVGGNQPFLAYGQRFLAKQENSELAAKLAFAITEPGYRAPLTPAETGGPASEATGGSR